MTPSGARWFRLAAYLAVVVMGAVGFWRVEQVQDRQCDNLERFAWTLGRELGADDERIDRFIDRLQEDLDHC